MARRLFTRFTYLPSLLPRISNLPSSRELLYSSFDSKLTRQLVYKVLHPASFQVSRSYARGKRKDYNLFGKGAPGSKEFGKEWTSRLGEEDCVWTESEDEDDSEKLSPLEKEIRKVKRRAKELGEPMEADDSDEDELWNVMSDNDEEKTLWTGSEDSDRDMPSEPIPNEKSNKYSDKVFEFEERPKLKCFSDALKPENWDFPKVEELSPGKNARKLAVENALKKLKKGPDGRYINVWEVMSDLDILIGAFENIVSGPEYDELREGGPKQLNMDFFKDIQARMRDPNFRFSPEVKLKPKIKIVSKKRWLREEARRRKDRKRQAG